ncbi:MAG TPA: FMN-binding negative transcriptional regulator [Actinophytocola sp.]|jgi:transcriptional regulator|uniref:FMN-binding negative transcriptional regulator n=1 Tax=Actinophytocola sp. TaxID=1872138 RepID=UPI002F9467DC
MHVPTIYQADEAWAYELVQRHPLALLISNGHSLPYATHVPVVLPPGPVTGLTGETLWGHMNRANAHWAELARGGAAKLVFTGPHSYITPMSYHTTPAAPTWNFVAVHLTGTVSPLPEGDDTFTVVARTADVFEQTFGDNWDPEPSHGYFRSIVRGVGAFHFEVETVDAMFKLSQEKTRDARRRVARRLAVAASGCARDLSALMHAMDEYDCPYPKEHS